MEKTVLKGEQRTEFGTRAACRMRGDGWLPANLYGHGKPNLSFRVRSIEASRLIQAGNHMLTLEIDGQLEDGLIKEIQYDVYGDHMTHLDFARISLDEVVEMSVPIETHGTPKGVAAGGVLDVTRYEVTLKGKARLLPSNLDLEIGELLVGETLRVSDLTLPPGVEVMLSDDEPVIIVHPPRGIEADEETEGAEDSSEPEVIGQDKPSEGDGKDKE